MKDDLPLSPAPPPKKKTEYIFWKHINKYLVTFIYDDNENVFVIEDLEMQSIEGTSTWSKNV